MHEEDLPTIIHIRYIHIDLSIEASCTQECRVKDIGSVRCREDNDTTICPEAIHLG